MDYKRIYAEFIKDRREKESTLTGYVERHHIVPRCLGGDDDPDNLVNLAPEDHYFAHLLLAKIHGGSLWAPVRIMAAAALKQKASYRHARLGRKLLRFRRRYAIGREWANIRLTGEGHPTSDKKKYVWHHVDGRVERLTRQGLAKKYKFPAINLNPVVSGRSKSVFGWYLPSKNPEGRVGAPKGLAHHMADRRIYWFRHVSGMDRRCSRYDLCKEFKISSSHLGQLVAGKFKYVSGWWLGDRFDEYPADISGEKNANADLTIYEFAHIDGRRFVGTRHDLRKEFGIGPEINGIFIRGSCNGWYLPDRTSAESLGVKRGAKNGNYNATAYDVIHDDGRVDRLTLHEMHKKFGGTRSTWCKIPKGATAYGWRRKGTSPKRSMKGQIVAFRRVDGETFLGTQKEFADHIGCSDTQAWRVVRQGKEVDGWKVEHVERRKELSLDRGVLPCS